VCTLHKIHLVMKSSRMRWAGHVERNDRDEKCVQSLIRKSEGTRPLGRTGCKWEDNIKIDLTGTVLAGVNSILPAQDRDRWRGLLNTVMNLRVP
jgi:hypothetical protein